MKSFSIFFAMLLILVAVVGGSSHQQKTASHNVPVLSAAQRIERLNVPAPASVPQWMVTNMVADSANVGNLVSASSEGAMKDETVSPSAMREDIEVSNPSTTLMATQNMVLCARVEDLSESLRKLDKLVASAKGSVEEDMNVAQEESEKSFTKKIMLAPGELDGFLEKLNKMAASTPVTKVVKAQKNVATENISSLIMVNQQSLADLQGMKKSTKNITEKLTLEAEIRKVASDIASLNTQKEMLLEQAAHCIVLVSMYQDLTLASQNASLGGQLTEAFIGGLGNTKEILIKLVANWPFLVLASLFIILHFALTGSEKRKAQKAKLQEEFERALIGTQVVVTR